MRIPFDSLTLAAVIHELQPFVNSKVQRVSQLDDNTVVLGLYGNGGEAYLLLSCDPVFSRMHFITKRPPNLPQPPVFCATLRSRLDQSRLRKIEQIDFDRIAVLTFEQLETTDSSGEEQPGRSTYYRLIVELMGKHSNLIFVDEKNRILAEAKPIGPTKSSRVVLAGRTYEPPPLPKRPSLLKAQPGADLKEFEGASPFLVKLIEATGDLRGVQNAVQDKAFTPIISPGNGAYPLSVSPLGLQEFPRQSISIALEQHFSTAVMDYRIEQLKASLLSQLSRVTLSREAAIEDLRQAQDAAKRAGSMQLQGELILAYGFQLPEGSSLLEAADYEGNPLSIKLKPELTYLENANRYFEKAKHAKARVGMVEDQLGRLSKEVQDLGVLTEQIRQTTRFDELQDLQEKAKQRKWLHLQTHKPGAAKEDKPYEGHRIRELIGPGGATVLYGENATSNDYLTARVAKPDDYWLHIRGSASAHVVIRTLRHPEKVGRELLMFAAKVAVQNSPSKHSGFVAVDYTLKKYVRKPKGAPVGTALYTHEKTLHVEEG